MEISPIEDLDDPRIADYRNLKDAELARRRDRFIIEGRGNLLVLLDRSRYAPDSLLLSERALASLEAPLASRRVACPVFVAGQSVLDAIVGFPIHRGVLAACARGAMCAPLDLTASLLGAGASPRVVVLEGLTNHDNVGGIFRNAMAFGAAAVLLCPTSCDPLYRKAIRTSMGGSLVVPFARCRDLPDLLLGLKGQGFTVLALDPAPEGEDIARLEASPLGPTALLLGTEGEGLTPSALERADRLVRIGMAPGVDSLNVSVAAGIALHRVHRQDPGRDQRETP